MKVKDKVIIVTGAGSGIGRELSLQLLQKKAKIIGVDINTDALTETQKIAGVGDDEFKGLTLDITNQKQVEAFVAQVAHHFGTVDGIINNAGIIQPFISVNDLEYKQIHQVMDVNFFGTLYLTKAFLPLLLKRPEAHIINISSMGGFIPFPGQTIYGAAKAAVKILTEGLYAELKNTNIKVTVVHPGAIATNILINSGIAKHNTDSDKPQGKTALSVSKAAEIIIRAIEKDKYRVTVGKDANILDLMYRISPRFATNFIQKKMSKR